MHAETLAGHKRHEGDTFGLLHSLQLELSMHDSRRSNCNESDTMHSLKKFFGHKDMEAWS